jgi:hypothetical protein
VKRTRNAYSARIMTLHRDTAEPQRHEKDAGAREHALHILIDVNYGMESWAWITATFRTAFVRD